MKVLVNDLESLCKISGHGQKEAKVDFSKQKKEHKQISDTVSGQNCTYCQCKMIKGGESK